ncbi:PIN domain-containing protein [Streptomyces sp. NPDC001388]|uniref:PIN domain-containing protein n=1 Tax=Streptomyces sp. NPDC001388 TaxID=3364568 RepID=UPI0036A12A6D
MVPMVVVDELDQLKESEDRHVRWRARSTPAVLDRLFQQSTEQAVRTCHQAAVGARGDSARLRHWPGDPRPRRGPARPEAQHAVGRRAGTADDQQEEAPVR